MTFVPTSAFSKTTISFREATSSDGFAIAIHGRGGALRTTWYDWHGGSRTRRDEVSGKEPHTRGPCLAACRSPESGEAT